MRMRNLLLLVAICVVLMPAGAWAGGTGACYVVTSAPTWPGGDAATPDGQAFDLAGCADGFTQEECSSVDTLVEFAEGFTCADVALKGGFDWNGSCSSTIDPVGDVCIQLWSILGAQSAQGLCVQDIGGQWYTDLECGGTPVPTMPPAGLAALMMLMLAGALFFMAKRSPVSSGTTL
jgi:hypothetical protein